MNKLFIASIAVTWTATAFAAPISENGKNSKIVEVNFPKELGILKDENSGMQLTLENGLGYAFEKVDFGEKNKTQYLAVIYQAAKSPSNVVCKLVIIKTGKDIVVMPDVVLSDKSELGNCSSIKIIDLDGDLKPEVLVQSSNAKGKSLAPYIFSWDGNKLVDITPTTTIDGETVSAFRETTITDIKVGKSVLILDKPFESHDETGKFKTYLVENGKINQTGTYDFYVILDSKSKKKSSPIVLKPSVAEEGSYNLDIKNLSANGKGVEAEVTVNGVIVLKEQDIHASEGSASTTVNLSRTNEIKVKFIGDKDSKLQLSMVKN